MATGGLTLVYEIILPDYADEDDDTYDFNDESEREYDYSEEIELDIDLPKEVKGTPKEIIEHIEGMHEELIKHESLLKRIGNKILGRFRR